MNAPEDGSSTKSLPAPRQLPLKMVNWENMVPMYVTNISVTVSQVGAPVVTLGSVATPPVMNPKEWDELEYIPVQCVGRFIFHPDQLKAIIDVLTTVHQNQQRASVETGVPVAEIPQE